MGVAMYMNHFVQIHSNFCWQILMICVNGCVCVEFGSSPGEYIDYRIEWIELPLESALFRVGIG
jgi:hypothetical protein